MAGRPSKARLLAVWLNGEHVGNWGISGAGESSFTYEQGWFASPAFRPLSLSLPALQTNPTIRGPQVAAFFDNLLPDSDGIRRRLQSKFKTTGIDAPALLAAVGRDCVGAVQVLPPGEQPAGIDSIDAVPLNASGVEHMLRNAVSSPNAMAQGEEDEDLRLSIAGAQEKTALLWHEGRWCKPRGATPTTHIFKLPMGLVGNRRADMSTSVENEWLCARLLRAYGLPVADCEIATFGTTKVLVVERFDRRLARDGTHWLRLPQEDLCQATGTPAIGKYENDGGPGMLRICGLLAGSEHAMVDIGTFLKAQLVFLLLRATDGHAKNFSIRLQPGGNYHLTPLYDVLSAWPITGHGNSLVPPQQVRMAMAWLGKNRHYRANDVQTGHLEATIRKCGYAGDPARLVGDLLDLTPEVIGRVEGEIPAAYPAMLADRIFAGLREGINRLRTRD